MNCVIISAKFSPPQMSHFAAISALFKELGHSPYLLLHPSYQSKLDDIEAQVYYINQIDTMPVMDVAMVYNMSLHDTKILSRLKKGNNFKSFFVYHEPWYGMSYWIRDFFRGGVKMLMLPRLVAIHYFAKKLLKTVDCVILSSERGKEQYLKKDVKYNSTYKVFPLVFKDETKNIPYQEREYFSYIATASKEKNFPLFINFISHYLPIDPNLKVQIITKSDISKYWNHELDKYVRNGRILLQTGRNLENREINLALMRSSCTWLYYHHSTQSGVLARSFMCGSPILASNQGFQEFINGKNGLICSSGQFDDLYKSYNEICKKKEQMSKNSRESFRMFDYKEFKNAFFEILDR